MMYATGHRLPTDLTDLNRPRRPIERSGPIFHLERGLRQYAWPESWHAYWAEGVGLFGGRSIANCAVLYDVPPRGYSFV